MFKVCLYTTVDHCHSLCCTEFCRNTMDLSSKNGAYENYHENSIKKCK